MTGANRYAGLSRRERSTVAIAICVALPLALIAIRQFAQDAVPTSVAPEAALKVFDVPPPPPPPLPPPPVPMPTRTPVNPLRREAAVQRAAKPKPSDPGAHSAIAPAPIAAIVTAPILPIAPVPATDTNGFAGNDGRGAPGGAGEGNGGAGGDGAPSGQLRLTAAIWVRPPSPADFLREWPKNGYALKVPVHVVLVCAVRKGGQPFHCTVARESVAGQGFGTAAIRLAEESLVRPVLIDGHRTDRHVIVPLSFLPAPVKSVAPGTERHH